jgi:hypothetical protein
VALHRQAEVAAAGTVRHPQVDGAGLVRHCGQGTYEHTNQYAPECMKPYSEVTGRIPMDGGNDATGGYTFLPTAVVFPMGCSL